MKFSAFFGVLLISLLSCKKEPLPKPDNSVGKKGMVVLNEGLFQQNNASLSYIDEEGNVINDYFLQQNERLLGDTGNEMIIYGAKVYIIVHASSTLEVLDKSTLKSEKQIQFNYQGVNQLPRFILGDGKYVYVTTYDGYVNKIDTSTFSVIQRVAVGNNPEGLALSNGKLFVANSGGLNSPNYDSTLSVIDLTTFDVIDEVFVGANPGEVVADNEGDIYVVKRGDYGTDPSELIVLDAQDNFNLVSTGLNATSLHLDNEKLWVSHLDYSNNQGKVALYDVLQESILENDFINTSTIQTLYGVYADEQFLYCFDAKGFTVTGTIKKYNKQNGDFLQEFEVGLNPNSIIKLN